jgi:pimeloyl-ACP methyl ester carboxylesterase
MPEIAQYFPDAEGHRLFGMVCAPAVQSSDIGVVFCHPAGDEKQKSYRAIVGFARALYESGIPSLRFDCYGFGDSEGEIVEADIQSQVSNVATAMNLLQQQTGVQQIVLVGVRLGATIAVLAAQDQPAVTGLVAIAPVVNGEMYWSSMLRTQQMSYLTRGLKSTSRNVIIEQLEEVGHTEISGDCLSQNYVEQLQVIDLLGIPVPEFRQCLITAVAADDIAGTQAKELAERFHTAGVDVADWIPESRDFWTSEALYDGYLPQQLYTRTVKWLKTYR